MQIQKMMKDVINNHKSKIQIIQSSIISSISSLIYSEYIRNFKRKQIPVNMVMVPSIKTINSLLRKDGEFIEYLSNNLLDDIKKNSLFQEYSNAPELILFNDENIEILKTVFDIYIVPNIQKYIPDVITKKFDLGSYKMFRESNEIDIFDGNKIRSYHYEYIVDEAILQLFSIMLVTMKKDLRLPENNFDVYLKEDDILIIENNNAICPICINSKIIENVGVIELLKFVTDTRIEELDWNVSPICIGTIPADYKVISSQFNTISIVSLNGIEYNE